MDHLGLSGHRLNAIVPIKRINIGTFDVMPFTVPHDGVECYGFLIDGVGGRLMFFIDCRDCPYSFNNVTQIAMGINYDMKTLTNNVDDGNLDPDLADRILRAHMSLETAIDFLSKQDLSCVECIHVLHCSETNLNKEMALEVLRRVTGKLILI